MPHHLTPAQAGAGSKRGARATGGLSAYTTAPKAVQTFGHSAKGTRAHVECQQRMWPELRTICEKYTKISTLNIIPKGMERETQQRDSRWIQKYVASCGNF